MKTTLKFFAPTLLMFAFLAAFITSTATIVKAQTEDSAEVIADKKRLYDDCFLKDKAYNSADAAVKKTAMECGREYVKKYEAKDAGDPEKKAINDYLRKKIDTYDKAMAAKAEEEINIALYARFDTAYKATKTSKTWTQASANEVFVAGKAILAKFPDDIDTILDLASIGYDRTRETPPNNTFNADTLNYAKMAISKIEAGKPSEKDMYGAYLPYKTKTYADGKNNALGWMNYVIGYLNNVGKTGADKSTVDSFYKAQQYKTSQVCKFYDLYDRVGYWYLEDFNKQGTEMGVKLKASGNKETPETLQIYALQKGIADRALEAFARAYKNAKDVPNAKAADSYLKTSTEIFKFRFNKKVVAAGEVETYLNGLLAKPFTEPNAVIVPVVEVAPVVTPPTTTPTTGTGTTPTTKPTTPTTKPTTPPVKPTKPVKKPKK
jgi:hypothetical protein